MEPKEKPTSPNKPPENGVSTSHLIPDLIVQILIHLPIRILLYFKTVSKEWYSHITNSPVIRRRPVPDHNPAVGLFLPSRNNNDIFKYVPFFAENLALKKHKDHKSRNTMILSSCNGLLLCQGATREYVVYNPTTNTSAALPILDENVIGMNLVFDPVKAPNQYRVVSVCKSESLKIWIYSSQESWKLVRTFPYAPALDFSNGVYWNNSIHWLHLSGGPCLYYDLRSQLLKTMPSLPFRQFYYRESRNCYFGESCDHLHYIKVFGSKTEFDVYEMKRDYSEWFVKYHVDLSPVITANPLTDREVEELSLCGGFFYQYNLLSVVRGDEEEEEDASFLVLRIFRKVIRYDLVSKNFKTLHEYEDMASAEECVRYPRVNAFQYIESLCNALNIADL